MDTKHQLAELYVRVKLVVFSALLFAALAPVAVYAYVAFVYFRLGYDLQRHVAFVRYIFELTDVSLLTAQQIALLHGIRETLSLAFWLGGMLGAIAAGMLISWLHGNGSKGKGN